MRGLLSKHQDWRSEPTKEQVLCWHWSETEPHFTWIGTVIVDLSKIQSSVSHVTRHIEKNLTNDGLLFKVTHQPMSTRHSESQSIQTHFSIRLGNQCYSMFMFHMTLIIMPQLECSSYVWLYLLFTEVERLQNLKCKVINIGISHYTLKS